MDSTRNILRVATLVTTSAWLASMPTTAWSEMGGTDGETRIGVGKAVDGIPATGCLRGGCDSSPPCCCEKMICDHMIVYWSIDFTPETTVRANRLYREFSSADLDEVGILECLSPLLKSTDPGRTWTIVLRTERQGKVGVVSVAEKYASVSSGVSIHQSERPTGKEDERRLASCMAAPFKKTRLSKNTASGMRIPLVVKVVPRRLVTSGKAQ